MNDVIIVRGGGDLASGIIYKLYQCRYKILILETDLPTSIRRYVSFSEAVYQGSASVEDVECVLITEIEECESVWQSQKIPLMVDKNCDIVKTVRPGALIDAIIAKKNLGTHRNMAPLTIGVGPGFTAGEDVDFVVETMRGHTLGRVIREGSAIPNTGVPGSIGGYTRERVIHSPASGIIHNQADISDLVTEGQVIAYVGETPVTASITGVLRGMIRDGFLVSKGLKIADIDPREKEQQNCFTISDKARCIAGGVLEVLLNQKVLP